MKRFAVLLALPLICLAARAENELQLNEAQQRALGIVSQVLPAGEAGASLRLPAIVEVPPGQLRVIAAPVPGAVEQLAVVPGMAVRKGQVLATLSSTQALEIQRDAAQAAAQAALARQNLRRDEQLYVEGVIAQSRLQATQAAERQATAQAAERSRGLVLIGAAAGKLAGELQLRSPIDGHVLSQDAQLGQRLEAGAVIFRVGQLSPLWLRLQVPRALAAELKPGARLQVSRPALSGQVVAVGRSIDAQSQSVEVWAEIRSGADALVPGQMVEVSFAQAGPAGAVLPAAALVRQAGRTLVFVDAGGGRFVARPVDILAEAGQRLTVAGLAPGQRVVVGGVSGLKAMLAGHGAP